MSYESIRGRQFSPASLAETLDVSVSQIHRWVTGGKIAAASLGRRCTRIDGDSVANFLESRAGHREPRGKAAALVSQA